MEQENLYLRYRAVTAMAAQFYRNSDKTMLYDDCIAKAEQIYDNRLKSKKISKSDNIKDKLVNIFRKLKWNQ